MSHSRFQRPPGSGSGSGTGMGDELPQIAALYLVKFDVREGCVQSKQSQFCSLLTGRQIQTYLEQVYYQ